MDIEIDYFIQQFQKVNRLEERAEERRIRLDKLMVDIDRVAEHYKDKRIMETRIKSLIGLASCGVFDKDILRNIFEYI